MNGRKALQNLASDIFACFLQADYEDNLYLYEHRIHVSKVKCIRTASLNQAVFNSLVDFGLLRWRVKDKSIFKICHQEMREIAEGVKLVLSVKCQVEPLEVAIASFENIYQNVVAVTAKEPLPFLLFISSLKTFKETCVAFQNAASA